MTAMEDAMIVEEIKQLLERLVLPRLDVIAKQLEGLRQQPDSMESGMREFRRSWAFLNLAKKLDYCYRRPG